MEFTTKYWVVVMVIALILLVGSGALAVWICKIYDTQTPPSLPPSVSPFPDVVPIVEPPSVDPVSNNCYKWCNNNELCPDVKPTPCNGDNDCANACTVPNSVTNPPKCDPDKHICVPPYQKCITGFPTYPGKDKNGNPVNLADPSNLKPCITNTDCNVCTDGIPGEQMNCVFLDSGSTVNLCDNGDCQIQDIPKGYYCLPQRTGCDAHAGTATWTAQGWTCTCTWSDVMGGPECNILTACRNNETTSVTQQLQQLLVNCNDPSNPLCGQPWVPESNINPKGYYDKTKGISYQVEPNDPNAMPNCVCQCDGTQQNTYQNFTYDPNNHLTCALDPCNNTAWGRTLPGDAGYLLNAVPGLLYSFLVISPVQNQYLALQKQSFLSLTTDVTNTKFELNSTGQLRVYNGTSFFTLLATDEAGSKVGAQESFSSPYADGTIWVFTQQSGFPQRPDNLDNLVLYNPKGGRPSGAQFTDKAYNDEKRYLVYNTGTSTFSLGSLSDNPVVFQRVEGVSVNQSPSTPYIAQPMTNCACSGANSMSSVPGCFDSNDNFVGVKSLMNVTDWDTLCDVKYNRNVSAICDPYTIPGSVVTIQPSEESKLLCEMYADDLKSIVAEVPPTTSTNLVPFRSGLVPGLGLFINDLTQQEELRSVCTADPCTGAFGDQAFTLLNNAGNWDPLLGQCACKDNNTDNPAANFYSFPVDTLTKQWTKACQDSTNTSPTCVCNHITNPVCGVCQNACQGTSPCKNSTISPCAEANLSCKTDPVLGGPECVCLGNCINQGGKNDAVCMKQIPSGGICTNLENEPNVCVDPSETCVAVVKAYNDQKMSDAGLLVDQCDDENPPNNTVSYCTSSTNHACWDSQSPLNNKNAAGYCQSFLDTCPIQK